MPSRVPRMMWSLPAVRATPIRSSFGSRLIAITPVDARVAVGRQPGLLDEAVLRGHHQLRAQRRLSSSKLLTLMIEAICWLPRFSRLAMLRPLLCRDMLGTS